MVVGAGQGRWWRGKAEVAVDRKIGRWSGYGALVSRWHDVRDAEETGGYEEGRRECVGRKTKGWGGSQGNCRVIRLGKELSKWVRKM